MKWFQNRKREKVHRHCRTCIRRMQKVHENPEKYFRRLNLEFRKGWKDSYRDRSSGLDRTVMGMFMIGAIATAIGLI